MKFLNYIQFLWLIFALLDPDPNNDLIESGSGSETLVGTQFTKERRPSTVSVIFTMDPIRI
jgi:hypothetical protein